MSSPKWSPWPPHFFTFLTSLTHHLSIVNFSQKIRIQGCWIASPTRWLLDEAASSLIPIPRVASSSSWALLYHKGNKHLYVRQAVDWLTSGEGWSPHASGTSSPSAGNPSSADQRLFNLTWLLNSADGNLYLTVKENRTASLAIKKSTKETYKERPLRVHFHR